MMPNPPVLICGAGPAGLILALWLNRFQIPFRIIDKASAPGLASRANIIQSRTLEIYRQLGIADRILSAGHIFESVCISRDGHIKGRLRLDESGKDLSKYPFSFVLSQERHEEILNDILKERCVRIERDIELTNIVQSSDGVRVTIRSLKDGLEETLIVAYLAGCDGAHSFVRNMAGIKMEGGTYGKKFYVADVHVDSKTPLLTPPGWANMNISTSEFCMMIPLKERGTVRLVGYVPENLTEKPDLSFEDVRSVMSRVTHLQYTTAAWFSTYNLHHRVASKFRIDRIFLCGDACHLHSPTGGQGMNAGIGDSTNLAWKLASVLNNTAPESILETYEPERKEFAQFLVNTTDTIFNWISGSTWIGWCFRTIILSYVLPFLTNFLFVRKKMFMSVSQLKIAYPQSSLSCNNITPSKTKAGDRLPWITEEEKQADNHASLAACTWQIHVYGKLNSEIVQTLQQRGLTTNVYSWSASADKAGLMQDVLYLLRPDGHIGWIGRQSDGPSLVQYISDWGVGNMHQ